jgi:hypothetical protein
MSAGKETLLERAQAWVVDQAALSVIKLGRCPVEDVASAINIPVNTLRAAVQTTERLTVVDGDLDLTVCSDSVARSLDRWCNDVVRAVGCPVHIDELAELLTVHLGKTADSITSSIKSSVATSRSGLTLVNARILMNDWLPMFGHDDQEDILLENGVKADLLSALLAKTGTGSFETIQDFAVTLLRAIQNKPVRHKTLAVAFWALTKKQDCSRDMVQLMCDERLLWHSGAKGGRWVLSDIEAEYRSLVSDLVPMAEVFNDVNQINTFNDVPGNADPVKAIVIDAGLVDAIQNDLIVNRKCINLGNYGILEELLPAYTVIVAAMDGVSSVGFGRFLPTDEIPVVDINPIVTMFKCPCVEFISEDGEQVEDLVSPDSYIGTLKSDVLNPDNQDILDDSSIYTGLDATSVYTFPVYRDHVLLGLIPMCRLSCELIPWDVEYAPVTVHVQGVRYPCSIINRQGVRCLLGLQQLFIDETSHRDYMFTLTKLENVSEFSVNLMPLLDGEYAISDDRRVELDVYKNAEADNPTVVILTQILDDHPKGVSFERALRELRYIRRSSVHKLASILTTNDCFAQKPGTGVWRYNPKRADSGNDIARRTYLKSGF